MKVIIKMSEEIKVAYDEANKLISKIQSHADSLDTDLLKAFADKNELNAVKKVRESNDALIKVTEAYKRLLTQNNGTALQTIESFRTTDDSLSNSIKGVIK